MSQRRRIAVGHLDADCYYVSAERARDRFLVGKPVGVLGNQGACVIAKSYEMKASGVKTGAPIWEAVTLCPDGIYIKRDFRWYEILSREMLRVVQTFSPRVEYYSIDEFFFAAELSPNGGPEEAQALAQTIRDRVLQDVGVPATVGIARTRTLAKLISDVAKPFGALAALDPQAEYDLLRETPVAEIAGIGRRRADKLAALGLSTCWDLAQADRRLIRRFLTVAGEALWWELNGESTIPLRPERPLHKTLSRGGSLGPGTRDPDELFAWLTRNLERLIEELEHYALLTERLTVWIGCKDGQAGAGTAVLEAPTDRFEILMDAAKPCLNIASIPRATANRMHLIADKLSRKNQAQLGLFDPPTEQSDALAKLKRETNARYGRFILRSGATLPLKELYDDAANSYDICDIKGKLCF